MELEENITTVPLLEEADNLTLNDLLYIVQGLNSDRDRKLSLEKLRDFLQSVFKNITVVGIGNHPDTTTITPSGVTVSGMGGTTEIGKQAVTTTFLSAYSLTLRNSNHTVTLSSILMEILPLAENLSPKVEAPQRTISIHRSLGQVASKSRDRAERRRLR